MVEHSYIGQVRLIAYGGAEYPPLLRMTQTPPRTLYVVGEKLGSRCYVSVAGTRKPSLRGAKLAYAFGRELAMRGYSVVIGGARGVDLNAWRGVRDMGGHAVVIAPFLFEQRGGEPWRRTSRVETLVSEHLYRPEGRSVGQLLVARDRIIAGMSAAIVIPEAKCKVDGGRCIERGWGTRHTAEFGVKARRIVVVLQPEVRDPEHILAFRHLLDIGAVPARNLDEALQLVEGEARKIC